MGFLCIPCCRKWCQTARGSVQAGQCCPHRRSEDERTSEHPLQTLCEHHPEQSSLSANEWTVIWLDEGQTGRSLSSEIHVFSPRSSRARRGRLQGRKRTTQNPH